MIPIGKTSAKAERNFKKKNESRIDPRKWSKTLKKPQNFETPNPEFAPQKRSKTLKNKLSYTLWKIIVRIHCVKRTTSYPLGNKSLIIHLIELVPS